MCKSKKNKEMESRSKQSISFPAPPATQMNLNDAQTIWPGCAPQEYTSRL